MAKNIFYWAFSMILVSFSLALCTKADFGLSMIGAFPFIVHKWLVAYFPWFSQGVAEYVVQGFILLVTCIIVRGFKLRYLLSFAVAILNGLMIDGWLFIFGGNAPFESLAVRIIAFSSSMIITALGIACVFRTTLPQAVYELTVVEIARKYNFKQTNVKYFFDYSILVIDIALTLIINHKFVGIGIGTIVITLLNAPIIKLFSKLIDKIESILPKKKEVELK